MPVRARSSSEVEQNGVIFEARNRIGRTHASIQSEPYNGSESLSLGRRPEKRRKSDGLNTRLSRMLLRVNTSFIADLPAPGAKHPRNPSDGSSSSTVGHEIPQTPVDAIHNAVKSKNLGDGFAIIKAGSSPDKGRSGFLANKDLPSWRDADQQRGDTEKETRQRDLPSWLSQTFSALEPNHPLRALALADHSNSALYSTDVSAYQESLEPPATSRLEDTHDGSVFAFIPPVANSMEGEDAPTTMLAANQLDIDTFSAAEPTYDVVGEKVSFDLPANGLYVDDHLPADDAIYDKVQDTAEGFLPFTQPGPFARKAVHFLIPVRNSPLSVSNPTSNRSRTHSVITTFTEPNNRQTTCEPFATPGPTSRFSLVALNHAAADLMNIQAQSSDSLTLADDSMAEDDVFAGANDGEDPTVSLLSFNSSSRHLQNKPFSTPGPVFCAPPVTYFNSPTEDPDPDELEYNDIEREIEQLLSDGQLRETQNTMRFIAREHTEMAYGVREPAVARSAGSPTIGYPGQEELYIAEAELTSDRLNNKHDTFDNEERTMDLMPPEAELVTNSQAAIQLFSSPPYIRFAHMKGHENNDKAACSSPPEPFMTRKRRSPDLASTYMRFDRLPPPTGATYYGANVTPALPCTPRSQPPQQETRGTTEYDTVQAPGSASINNSTFTDARVPTPATKSATPKHQKQRRAFAPGPGVYLSPLCDTDEEEAPSRNDAAKRDADDPLMKSEVKGISPSQASDDSIENWET